MEKIDPNTQRPVIGANGKPVTEEQEVTIPAFKVVSVFDVSQTEGKELPDIAVDALTGDVDKYTEFFAALEKTAPVPVAFEKMDSGTHGYYHLEDKRIALAEGESQLQSLKTLIHEIAHAKLHDIDLNAPISEQQSRPDRRTREVEAESIAYTVCQHYGLDTSDYSFGYVAGWSSGKELSELKSSLETIRSTAAELINTIDGHIAEMQKEQTAEQEAKPDLAAEPTVTIIWSESSRLHEGETMSLSRANVLFATLDDANKNIPGYDKTAFRIDFMMNGKADQYEGRQDFGDGEGGLIEHIEKYHAYYVDNPEWDNYLLLHEGKDALEADKAQRGILLHEFIPYLKLHNNLSEMEQAAQTVMQQGSDLSQTQTAYYTDLQRYVSDCRGALNQGNYELPPVPQLSDFDAELQAYKQQVKEEITQEAASAGMTVDEYAANGYEPYTTPEQDNTFSIYQLKGGEETRDFRFEPYDRLQAAGLALDPANYELTYTAPLEKGMSLEGIFEKFNLDRPTDFTGHSLSVSDVVVLHQNGQDTAHYVDSFGYKDVPEFLQPAPVLDVEQPQEAAQPDATPQETAVTYYPINETAARRAKEANSFSDYKPGSATAEYRSMVDEAKELAERQKARVDPMHHEKIDRLLDTYARKLAENMNSSFAIESRVPSILIAGGSNFPVRKKEKQNAARDRNMEEWQDIKGLLEKIRSTGMGGISADDPNAIGKLESKLAGLEKSQETMKAANAFYRKHKTLDGCPVLTAEQIQKLSADMQTRWYGRAASQPFEAYALQNNNAEINRLKKRIAELTHREETPLTGWEFDGGKVEINKVDNRLQVFFDEKPDEEKRTELKKGGFRWSPTAGAWQRQLNGNALYAANDIKCIQPLTGERPTDLQRAHIRAEKAKEQAEQPPQDSEQQAAVPAPDSFLTGETVKTPRGSFRLTSMSKQEIEAAGYGFHHQSDDGKYFIMGNGTWAFAIQSEAFKEQTATVPTPKNPLAAVEQTTEQNENMIDGIINNTPTVGELEAKVKAGEQISLTDLAAAIKADKQRGSAPKEKPSIRAQLKEGKEKATPKKAAKTKNQDLEV